MRRQLFKSAPGTLRFCSSIRGRGDARARSKVPYTSPAVRPPPLSRLLELNEEWDLQLNEREVEDLRACMTSSVLSFQRVDALLGVESEVEPARRHPRVVGGRFLSSADNPLNAWYVQVGMAVIVGTLDRARWFSGPSARYCTTDVRGAPNGKLQGRTIAIKDSIAVAGVPMMNGSRILEGYTPEYDATVVTRVLDAGGVIAGKAVAEDLCCSGSSFATARGPVLNPHNPEYCAGGSSSGCAALLGGGVVDMAIGSDQGGSIRIPASWCGVVGLKPTFGLVPFTGSSSHEFTMDHLGPMASTVGDAALLLEVIAGYDDGLDSRQPPDVQSRVQEYSKQLGRGVRGLRLAVLQEGLENCEPDVEEACLDAVEQLRQAGATVDTISISMHRDSLAIWLPMALEGGHMTRMEGGGVGMGHKGYYPTSLQRAYRRGFQCHASELSYTNKFYILFGEYLRETYGMFYYGRCQNLSRALTREYNRALLGRSTPAYDALLMPTSPIKAKPMLEQGASAAEYIQNAWCALQNTAAFDLTGHPAVSVNVRFSAQHGLPIGLQVVGRQWDDGMVLNVAKAVEEGSAVKGRTGA